MPSTVTNLLWVYPKPAAPGPVPVPRNAPARLDEAASVRAVILYPALLTPAILVGDSDERAPAAQRDLELLLLVHRDDRLSEAAVKDQLRASAGLEALKPYPLLSAGFSSCSIELLAGDKRQGIKRAGEAFGGLIDEHFMLRRGGRDALEAYTQLYRVRVEAPRRFLAAQRAAPRGGEVNARVGDRLVARGALDGRMLEVLRELNGELPANGLYCLRVGAEDVDYRSPNLEDPIQTFHPVYELPARSQPTLGFLSDIHVSSRHAVLARSRARVIEYCDAEGRELDADVSPPVGDLVVHSSRSMKAILEQMGDPAAPVDVVLLGWDFIDYVRNVYPGSSAADLERVPGVWDALSIEPDDYTRKYRPFIDFVAFYSLLLDFARRRQIPMFAIAGNHDCYPEAFGISPRAHGQRGNEGIPADHNLTIYEAILAFGPTFGNLMDREQALSGSGMWTTGEGMMDARLFPWFYSVFTPFSDYWVRLPGQLLVALAWGDTEDLVDIFGDHKASIGRPGHLPRADEGVSDAQLGLLEDAWARPGEPPLVLMTHFPFVCYQEPIPLTPTGATPMGEVDVAYGRESPHAWGTFETNRDAVYERFVLGGRRPSAIVSGHTHRRGLYGLVRLDGSTLYTRSHEFASLSDLRGSYGGTFPRPALVVADSAGPVPRNNRTGELCGWGSDRPAGARLSFAANGDLARVEAVQAGAKPRVAVSVDYLDLLGALDSERVLQELQTDSFLVEVEARTLDDPRAGFRAGYAFSLRLHPHLARYGIEAQGIDVYGKIRRSRWVKVSMLAPVDAERQAARRDPTRALTWRVPNERARDLRDLVIHDAKVFLSLRLGYTDQFAHLWRQYDFESRWNFEAALQVDEDPEQGRRRYRLVRRLGWEEDERAGGTAEVPDFAWREDLWPSAIGERWPFALEKYRR